MPYRTMTMWTAFTGKPLMSTREVDPIGYVDFDRVSIFSQNGTVPKQRR